MKECSRNKLLVGLVKDEKQKRTSREAVLKEYNVAGCVHPLRPQMTAKGKVPAGSTVEFAVKEACKSAGVRESFSKRGVAQIGTRDFEKGITVWRNIPKSTWAIRKLKEGELLRFRLLPSGGGGGGKNPLRTILTVVVAIVAIAAAATVPGLAAFAPGAALAGMGSFAGGLAGLAITTIGMVLVNAIAPVRGPSVKGLSNTSSAESKVYSVSAGRNSIDQWGRVPAPLGRGRFAAPKAASPYTQTIGEDQYLHELLCLGVGDMDVSELKLGTTNIEEFQDCQYEIYQYDPEKPYTSPLYPTGVFQEDLSIELKEGVRNTRTTAECDHFELDFSFNGLTYYKDDGGKSPVSVEFLIQYREQGSVEWEAIAVRQFSAGRSLTVTANMVPSSYRDCLITVNPINGIRFLWDTSAAPTGDVVLGKIRATKRTIHYSSGRLDSNGYRPTYSKDVCALSLISGQEPSSKYLVEGFSISVANGSRAREASINVSGGYLLERQKGSPGESHYTTYTGAQSKLLRKTFTIKPPKRGIYEVSTIRITPNSSNDRLVNASYWGALRSMTNDNPVNTDYPVNLLAVKIRASGQLSGAIETLTHYYETKILDWDSETETWEKRYSSNPASLFRHILQDKVGLARPQPDELIDLESIQEAHEFWESKGWQYNLICDSSVSVFERLQSICASGLASPTMSDGKWAIIIDKPRENIACAFTSANSWSWSFRRTQVRLPQDIHCSFISDRTWDTDMRVVATDEPRTDQYLYESQTYEGVNDPAQVYQLARFHYADAKVRRRSISLRCYDESILCTRGDLVECAAPSVSPHGLQVGRIRKIEKDEDGNVVALYTDQLNSTDFSGRRFGVKVYAQSGAVLHAEILPENKTWKKLTLTAPQPMDVHVQDKYAFGDYSEETFQAIVLGMKYNSDWTCDITLQDYTPQLYGNLEEPIPDFKSVITVPITGKWEITSLPFIEDVVTDERALLQTKSGTAPRILVHYKHPVDLDSRAIGVSFEISIAGENKWTVSSRNYPLENSQFYYEGVSEENRYDLRIKYVGAAGESGKYVYRRNIPVIGRTTPPPPPSSVFINGSTILIQQNNRPLDVVGHKVYMVSDEEDDIATAIELTNPYTVTGTFDLKPWAGKARAIFVRTVDEIGLLSTPVRIVVDLGSVSAKNILFEVSEKEREWSGDIVGGYVSGNTLYSEENVARYPQDNGTPFYLQENSSAFYPSGVSATLIYTWKVEILKRYANARVLVLPEILSGKLVNLLFRHWTDIARYGVNSSTYYPQDNSLPMYPQQEASDWAVMPEEYVTPGSEILEMKVTYSPVEQAQISDIKTVIDVDDIDITFEDIIIASDGSTRAPIPVKTYHAIGSVIPGIQYEEGDDVLAVKYIKGSETLDEDGYVMLGPVIRAFNAAGSLTSANCDIRVKGY